MRISTIPSVTGLLSHDTNRPSAKTTAPATTKPQSVVRAVATDRAMRLASTAIIVALLDITCILWVCPIATQLALWVGISWLNTVYIGLGAMLASIPIILAATILLCRRAANNRG